VVLRVVLFSCLLWLLPSTVHAQKRVALVIGNSAYRYAPELANPKNDASDVAAALAAHGFEVITGFDLDRPALERKIGEFAASLQRAEVGLFFYAGHGLQVSGRNYLVPVDAQLKNAWGLELEMMRVEVVQGMMENATQPISSFLTRVGITLLLAIYRALWARDLHRSGVVWPSRNPGWAL
jgi:uncharacterized caspase-like protein